MEPRRQRLLLLCTFLGAICLFYLHSNAPHTSVPELGLGSIGSLLDLPDLPPANSTLGFGAIAAVSRPHSARRESLLLAANITELDITIPHQPQWSEDDLASIRAHNNSHITRGSALAWLGHLNALRWFLSTDLESVLILEDDVDWDIHLRTAQVPKVAATVRHLLAPSEADTSATTATQYLESAQVAADNGRYWADPSSWDILYLGHCGDIFAPTRWTEQTVRAAFHDYTLPEHEQLHPYTRQFLEKLGVPPDVRLVHESIFPLCTFGFAVSRHAAERLLHEIAARESDGGTMAYDVRILEACRDQGLRCWSVNPELFHHMNLKSEIAVVDASVVEDGDGHEAKDGAGSTSEQSGESASLAVEPMDPHAETQNPLAGAAPNIACGARSHGFYTKDPKTVEYLKEVVGRQGHCLKDEIEQDEAGGL